MSKRILLSVALSVLSIKVCFSQVYTEKQTRHRFAQLTLGLDVEASFGGNTKYRDNAGNINDIHLQSSYKPRFVIGGTHFWGHADFLIAIPFYDPLMKEQNQEIQYSRGVETAFKYYPWRIEHHKFRPFIGVSMTPVYFEQVNKNVDFGNGPELNRIAFPILTGVTYNNKNHLLEMGMAWDYSNRNDYYINPTTQVNISSPPIYLNLSYKYMLETTLSAEKGWESGQTETITEQLASQNKLNGFYVGIGLSSAFWLGKSSYNTIERSFVERYGESLMPDFGIGYYFHQPDVNIALGYRGYGTSTNAYGVAQMLKRKSLIFEATKYLFDYHGFVPFVGPSLSYENLNFKESFENQETHDVTNNKIGYSITFGWDIRPNRIQNWILRTNLRWFPNLNLEVDDTKDLSFNNLEFNFIQLIIYPNRMVN